METHGPIAMNAAVWFTILSPVIMAGNRTSGRMAPHLTTLPKEVVANPPHAPWRSSELKPKVADMNANDFPTISSSTAEIHSYAELQQRIHDDLRVQHPEWVKSNGDCPTCDAYERRLAELIGLFQSSERKLAAA